MEDDNYSDLYCYELVPSISGVAHLHIRRNPYKNISTPSETLPLRQALKKKVTTIVDNTANVKKAVELHRSRYQP